MNEDELLRRDFVIYIFKNFVIKKEILYINHNDSKINHFTRKRIKNAIRRKYF